jgi:hypothetical protein
MMFDKYQIAFLWIIRESKGGVSTTDLINQMIAGTLPVPVHIDSYLLQSHFERGFTRYVREFIELGLVSTLDGSPFHRDAKLVTTPLLGSLQDMFNISLNGLMRQSAASQVVNPLFGRPVAKNEQHSQVFVAMPFTDSLKPIYTDHILKVAQDIGMSCKRGDDFFSSHSIMSDVWSAINHADICIVDCTGRNPNVFYELGIAHTLGRKTIMIAQSIADIPFDVRHLRTIIYQYTPVGMQQFETALLKTIKSELATTSSE